jgi:hypothetical protein
VTGVGKPVVGEAETAGGGLTASAGAGAGRAGPSTKAAAAAGIDRATGSPRLRGPSRIAAGWSVGWMQDVGDIGQIRCPAACCTGPKGCKLPVQSMTRSSRRWYGRRLRGRVSATREGATLRRNKSSRRRL